MDASSTNADLLAAWQSGDQQAARILVDRYVTRLTALVRARLSRRLARRVDAEDVVLSAWRSFFIAAGNGRVQPDEDGELWPLLATLALRKLSRQAARQRAGRRSIDREQPDASQYLAELVAADPTPDAAAALADDVERLVTPLEGIEREVFVRRLRGESTAEIAVALRCSDRTVRRAAERVRAIVADHLAQERGDEDALREDVRANALDGRTPTAATTVHIPKPNDVRRPTFSIDQLLLLRMIGEGGFGKVYRALDCESGESLAVKFLRKSLWSDARAVDSLLREGELLAELNDPGIAAGRGWGRTPYGAVFLVMEEIEGECLDVWVRERSPQMCEIVSAVANAADAVARAHDRGILHCDLKPSNLLRRRDGSIVLTDFGFARRTVERSATFPAGGTAGYMAPEQISDAFGSIGPRTDVYGLGAVLYALVTGKPPLQGRDAAETLARVLSAERPLSLSSLIVGIPRMFDDVVLKCLEKEPQNRFPSVDEIAKALHSVAPFCTEAIAPVKTD